MPARVGEVEQAIGEPRRRAVGKHFGQHRRDEGAWSGRRRSSADAPARRAGRRVRRHTPFRRRASRPPPCAGRPARRPRARRGTICRRPARPSAARQIVRCSAAGPRHSRAGPLSGAACEGRMRGLGQLSRPPSGRAARHNGSAAGPDPGIQARSIGSSMMPVSMPFSHLSHQRRHSCRKPICGPGKAKFGYLCAHGPTRPFFGQRRCSSMRKIGLV